MEFYFSFYQNPTLGNMRIIFIQVVWGRGGGSQMEQLLASLPCNMRVSENGVSYKSLNGFFVKLSSKC